MLQSPLSIAGGGFQPVEDDLDFYTYGADPSPSPRPMAEGGEVEADVGGLPKDLPPDALEQLIAMIQQSGGSPEEIEALIQDIIELSQTPGGLEMLFSETTDEILKAQGMKRGGRVQSIRLYDVPAFAEGGLARAAETTRQAGRDEDEVLLHMTPEEFEALQAMWGPPDINPMTGLPEYGFLKRAFKKVKNVVKKIVKNPIFQVVAPIALNAFVPGLGVALGTALGATGSAAGIIGSSIIGAGFGAASGNGLKGTLAGAIGGAGAGGLGGTLGKSVGLTGTSANVLGNAALSAAGSGVAGEDPLKGAVVGGLATYAIPKAMDAMKIEPLGGSSPQPTNAQSSPVGKGVDPFANGPPEFLSSSRQVGPPAPLSQATSAASVPVPGSYTPVDPAVYGLPGAPVPPPGGPTTPQTWSQKLGTTLSKNALPIAGLISATGAFSSPGGQPQDQTGYAQQQVGPEYSTPLPQYTYSGQQFAPSDLSTYGQKGGEETLFKGTYTTPESAAKAMNSTPEDLTKQGYKYQGGSWVQAKAQGGLMNALSMMQGGSDPRIQGEVSGPGTGRTDEIPAALSDGEYVMDAETVSLLGDGSNDAGADRLDQMRENLRKHKGANLARGEISPDAKDPLQYLPNSRVSKAKGGRAKDLSELFAPVLEDLDAALEAIAERKIKESGIDTSVRDPDDDQYKMMEELYAPNSLVEYMRNALMDGEDLEASNTWYDLVEKYPEALAEAQDMVSVIELDEFDQEMSAIQPRGSSGSSGVPSPDSLPVNELDIRGKWSEENLPPDTTFAHAKGGRIDRALKFITDMGDSLRIEGDTDKLGFDQLKRYGVWQMDPVRGKPQVIETSDDLRDLLERHGLKESDVKQLAGGGRARLKLAQGGRVTPASRLDSVVEAMFKEWRA